MIYRPIRTYTAPTFDRRPTDPRVWTPIRNGGRSKRVIEGQP